MEPKASEQIEPGQVIAEPLTQDQIAEAVQQGILRAKERSMGGDAIYWLSRALAGFVFFFCALAASDGSIIAAIFAGMFFWFTFRR